MLTRTLINIEAGRDPGDSRPAENDAWVGEFVQDMMRDFGAKIVPGSIKPAAPAPTRPV